MNSNSLSMVVVALALWVGATNPAVAQTTGPVVSESVIVDLSRLRPDEEVNSIISRKRGQLRLPDAFTAAMENAEKAMRDADRDYKDHVAVDRFYLHVRDALGIWSGYLEDFIADEGQALRAVGELRERYGQAAVEADAKVKAFVAGADARGLEAAEIERLLERATEQVAKLGDEELDDERADLVIRLLIAEVHAPIRERVALASAVKARIVGDLARLGHDRIDVLHINLTRRYLVARSQLALVPGIAALHGMGVETEQFTRMAEELQSVIGEFDASPLDLNLPAFFTGGLTDGTEILKGVPSDNAGSGKAKFVTAQLEKRRAKSRPTKTREVGDANP